MIKDIRKSRLIKGAALFLAVLIFFISFLFKTQVVDKDKYSYISDRTSVSQRKVTAARGVILDRNGAPLVSNRQGNSIIFEYEGFPSYKKQGERNEIIKALIELFESAGEEWLDGLPIVFDSNGNPQFTEDSDKKTEYMKSSEMLRLNEYATAQNCYDALVKRYELESYPKEMQRKIASVCFSMKYLLFSDLTPYIFAQDVSTELVSAIKENGDLFRGVDVQVENYREYSDGTLAPHILGFVGGISAEEYESEKKALSEALSDKQLNEADRIILENNKYELNDTYGKSGIEQYAEKYLRGSNGIMLNVTDSEGNLTTEYSILPKQGNTVVTTIDSGLQKAAAESLQRVLDKQQEKTSFATAGALIVIDVKTGAIRACVSNPTYDISTYTENYSKLVADKSAPLWNRALLSTYAPGSTMKPAVALAALTEGTITPSTVFTCHSVFSYLGTTFTCLAAHGTINVRQSLRYSCNVFYYNTGKELGIEKMNYYSTLLGLGQKTGVELPEATGVLAGEAEREAAGGVWYPGDTVQAAIGQSDNLFTPMQLASYCATIASGGTRFKPYFIDSVFTSDMSELVYKTEPEVTKKIDFTKETIDTVRAGMRDVVTLGGCQYYFKDCVVEAAAKTGTSQVFRTDSGGNSVKTNNGFLISFAPYDDPEIAVVMACENVSGGSAISGAACDVYNYYFSNLKDYSTPQSFDELIP